MSDIKCSVGEANNKNGDQMKKLILFFTAMAVCSILKAADPVYTGDLINSAICVDTQPVINLNTYKFGYSGYHAIYSSATFASKTFTDGQLATGSITVASNTNFTIRAATNSITIAPTASLAPVKASNRITITTNSALTGAILTINGQQLIEGRDWTKTATATGTAANLQALLDVVTGIDASRVSNVVYTTASVAGLVGNSYTMSSSTPAALTVLSANFTGGKENGLTNAVLTVNGIQYRNGYLWSSLDTNGIDNSSMTATSLASLLNTISGLSAQAISSVVYTTATTGGTAGNSYTLASNDADMVVNSANYVGGRDTTTITINGVTLTNGTDWATGASAAATSKNISDAIMANSSLNTIIRSTWNASAVVTSTSLAIGTGVNYSLATNNATAITLSGSAMTGGASPSWTVNTPTITIASHGYSLGLGVLYSTGAVAISGLTNQTTYYVTPVDTNSIKLSSSKANAVAGTYITLASSSTTGTHTYTLTPVGISGTPTFKWQASNDNSNWVDLAVSSVTFSSPYTATSNFWDFGYVPSVYLRLNYVSPTTGCINLRAIGNSK